MSTIIFMSWAVRRPQPRKLKTGENVRGNVMGPFDKPDLTNPDVTWTISFGDKKQMYGGAENLPLPSGRCDRPGDEPHEQKDPKDRIKNSDLTPAFFHEGPPGLVTEIAHSLQCVAVIDLTPGSGHWALEAVRRKIPYVGFGYTQLHCDMLASKLRSRILTLSLDANEEETHPPP